MSRRWQFPSHKDTTFLTMLAFFRVRENIYKSRTAISWPLTRKVCRLVIIQSGLSAVKDEKRIFLKIRKTSDWVWVVFSILLSHFCVCISSCLSLLSRCSNINNLFWFFTLRVPVFGIWKIRYLYLPGISECHIVVTAKCVCTCKTVYSLRMFI